MSDERFIVETVEITDCKTGKSRIAKVITDTHELCSCEDLYELCDDLNNLAEENEQLRRLFEEMEQPITINLTEEDAKELRKLLGLIDDE